MGEQGSPVAFASKFTKREQTDDADIARAVVYALSQPERVDVNEILIRPTQQAS